MITAEYTSPISARRVGVTLIDTTLGAHWIYTGTTRVVSCSQCSDTRQALAWFVKCYKDTGYEIGNMPI